MPAVYPGRPLITEKSPLLECVVNISEGRNPALVTGLADVCGRHLLDVHSDPDHHRTVLTLAGHGADLQDSVRALATLKQAFTTDAAPVIAMARQRAGGAIDPLAVYRASGYRQRKAEERPAQVGASAGIV